MSNGIEFLLTEPIRSEQHDRRWNMPHFALDNESLHQELLIMMLTRSPNFCTTLLSESGELDRHSQEFDIWMKLNSGNLACIEIKVWHSWTTDQVSRQVAELERYKPARGYVILLGGSSQISRNEVQSRTQENFVKISYEDLYKALDSVTEGPSLCEIAVAYKEGLKQQENRIKHQHPDRNPNE